MIKSTTDSMRRVAQILSAVALAWAATASADAAGPAIRQCERGDGGRLIRYEKVGSYPTAQDASAHFEEWIAFYQDFYQFP